MRQAVQALLAKQATDHLLLLPCLPACLSVLQEQFNATARVELRILPLEVEATSFRETYGIGREAYNSSSLPL